MRWDELVRELSFLNEDVKHSLGFGIGWICVPFLVLALVITVLKTTIFVRAWWLRPYASPAKLLSQLAKTRGVSSSQLRILRGVRPNATPLHHSQMLLDPSAWPAERKSPREVRLYEWLFPNEHH